MMAYLFLKAISKQRGREGGRERQRVAEGEGEKEREREQSVEQQQQRITTGLILALWEGLRQGNSDRSAV